MLQVHPFAVKETNCFRLSFNNCTTISIHAQNANLSSSPGMDRTPQRDKPAFREKLRRGLLLFAGFYVLICACCASLQRRLIYFPAVVTGEQVDQMTKEAGLERWTNSAGQFIGLKRLSSKQPAAGSVMVMYGNGSTAVGSGRYADQIQAVAAFDVFILEYPGYEDRPGSPSQKSLFAAADEAFQQLPTNRPIYLVGESLGTGVASYLAGANSNKIAGVIFISPFNSLADVAQYHYPLLPVRWLVVDRFPSEKYLRNYRGKLGVTVDGKDTVVPKKFSVRLYEGYTGPKKLWEVPEGEHCQIPEPSTEFWQQVIAFWQSGPSR
jgi:pimeloyl-ACP methyl ester carboxylesterase